MINDTIIIKIIEIVFWTFENIIIKNILTIKLKHEKQILIDIWHLM